MKEVKAYVLAERVFEVIHHLEAAGGRDVTVIEVKAIGALVDARADHHLARKYAEKYSAITKLEIVCRDEEGCPLRWDHS